MWALQILNRLETMHNLGYIHRDLKPGNTMIGNWSAREDHMIYLIDFGLSKKRDRNSEKVVNLGLITKNEVIGTLLYASVNAHNTKMPY
jgi:serine/threonine protein kinase